jgi:hypothetical protein
MERLRGRAHYTEEDEELQAAFRRLFRPGDFGYRSAARIGRDFLRRHADLLIDKQTPTAPAAVRLQ